MKRLALLIALLVLIPISVQADPTDCNAVVSMSQGRQVYAASRKTVPPSSPLEASTGEQWMLLSRGGTGLPWWTVAANWNGLDEHARCGTDAEIDSIVFIFDPRQSQQNTGTNMIANLGLVEDIVASRYPNAIFYPTMLVGAEGHVDCVGNGQVASASHADRIDTLEASSFTVGPDLDIPCTSFADPLGHLTSFGAIDANGQVGDWFNGLQAPAIPATIPHPNINIDNGYEIIVSANNPSRQLWRAPYLYDVPYTDDVGWVAGDRIAYGCAYGFLIHEGELVGRFTFRNLSGSAAYIVINDKFMDEGQRHYDGTPNPNAPQQLPQTECPSRPTGYESSTVSQLPRVVFWSGNEALEIRDYREVNAGPGVTFELLPTQAGGRIPVLARENGVPALVVYYDPLGSGLVTADLP